MKLYEVTNGFHGESYVRVYVWCKDERTALRMAEELFRQKAGNHGAIYWNNLIAGPILRDDDGVFATLPSDDGSWTRA